jgi:3-mercaptopropionate dioxygenase
VPWPFGGVVREVQHEQVQERIGRRVRGAASMTAAAPLTRFTDAMDRAVASCVDPSDLAAQASVELADLLAHPEAICEEHRVSSDDGYRQHVVYVHPQGRYSLVALVWQPGQATPIHDHRCWCVVGVLQGEEEERRYRLMEHEGEHVLVLTGTERHGPGSITSLVPPEENIHLVSNSADELTLSLHVYGDDIARCGSSINHIFDPGLVRTGMRGEEIRGARFQSWRSRL